VNDNKHYDALVVGSGASGSIAVKELTERGLEVLLLEPVATSPMRTLRAAA
jgi:choline dehydrogenase-like flavoprotein